MTFKDKLQIVIDNFPIIHDRRRRIKAMFYLAQHNPNTINLHIAKTTEYQCDAVVMEEKMNNNGFYPTDIALIDKSTIDYYNDFLKK